MLSAASRPLRDGGDGQVVAADDAVAAGPDLGQRGAALGIDLDAAGLERDRRAAAVERRRLEALADRLEHLVGRQRDRLAGAGEPAALHGRVFQLDAGDLAALGDDLLRLQPVADDDAVGLSPVPARTREAFMCSWPRR